MYSATLYSNSMSILLSMCQEYWIHLTLLLNECIFWPALFENVFNCLEKKSKWLVRVNFWFWVISKHQYDQGFYPINLHFSSGFRSLWYQLHVNTYKYQKGHKSIYYTRYICRIAHFDDFFSTSSTLWIEYVYFLINPWNWKWKQK